MIQANHAIFGASFSVFRKGKGFYGSSVKAKRLGIFVFISILTFAVIFSEAPTAYASACGQLSYAFSDIYSAISGVPYSSSKVFHNKKNQEMKIALTFDDGPHPIYTPIILDILKEYGIHATFFMVGENVAHYRDVAERVLTEGHEVGNHTYSHPHLLNMTYGTLLDEMLGCEDVLFTLSEYKPHLFRPPEGLVDKDVISIADKLEYSVILWNVDTRDWANTPSDKIVENVIKNTDSGDIILMHDYIGYNSPTPEALRKYIPILLKKGFKFVTVSELLNAG